nr:peptidoglycan-binding protein [Xenococcaceae cyanobacterium MO_188.B29]
SELSDPKLNFDLSNIPISSPHRPSQPPPRINPKLGNKQSLKQSERETEQKNPEAAIQTFAPSTPVQPQEEDETEKRLQQPELRAKSESQQQASDSPGQLKSKSDYGFDLNKIAISAPNRPPKTPPVQSKLKISIPPRNRLQQRINEKREETLTEELRTSAISSRSASRRASPSIPRRQPKQFDNSNFVDRVSQNERSQLGDITQSSMEVFPIQSQVDRKPLISNPCRPSVNQQLASREISLQRLCSECEKEKDKEILEKKSLQKLIQPKVKPSYPTKLVSLSSNLIQKQDESKQINESQTSQSVHLADITIRKNDTPQSIMCRALSIYFKISLRRAKKLFDEWEIKITHAPEKLPVGKKIPVTLEEKYLENLRASLSRDTGQEGQNINSAIGYNKKRGYGTETIKKIQRAVGLQGNDVDGIIGPTTVRRIIKWQHQNHLAPDGKVGPETFTKMFASELGTLGTAIKESDRLSQEPVAEVNADLSVLENGQIADHYLKVLEHYTGRSISSGDKAKAKNGLSKKESSQIIGSNRLLLNITAIYTQGYREFQNAGGSKLDRFFRLEQTIIEQVVRGNPTAIHNYLKIGYGIPEDNILGIVHRKSKILYYDSDGFPLPNIAGPGMRDDGYIGYKPSKEFGLNINEIDDLGLRMFLNTLRQTFSDPARMTLEAANIYFDNVKQVNAEVQKGLTEDIKKKFQEALPFFIGFLAGHGLSTFLMRVPNPAVAGVGLALKGLLTGAGYMMSIECSAEAMTRLLVAAKHLSRVEQNEQGKLTGLSEYHLKQAAVPIRQMVSEIALSVATLSLARLLKGRGSAKIECTKCKLDLKQSKPTKKIDDNTAKAKTSKASKELGKALDEAGHPRPKGDYQAAHIVPTGDFSTRSAKVRKAIEMVQKKFNQYLPGQRNKAINGFWAEPGHAGTHTDKFFLELGKQFMNVKSPAQAKAALTRMWKKIESGDFQ